MVIDLIFDRTDFSRTGSIRVYLFYTLMLILIVTAATAMIVTTTDVFGSKGKGLKLYLTVDTNLASQDIGIETFQYGDNIYNHDGFMNTGSNEYTLNYPRGLVDNGSFEICIQTNDGRYCGNGYNSEEKKPESVFISAFAGSNFGSVPSGDSQAQSQSQNNEQSQSQSQSNDQSVVIYNCPADSTCRIEQ